MADAIADTTPEPTGASIREMLRAEVKVHTFYKRWETRCGNALKIKRGGEEQKRPTDYIIPESYRDQVMLWKGQTEGLLDACEKRLRHLVHQLPIWTEWAEAIKPLGEITIAYLEAFVDLSKALDATGRVTPSKVHTFCGYGDVNDKGAPGKRKYCEDLKTQLYQWGLSLEKQGERCESKYHAIYLGAKERHANSDAEVRERKKDAPAQMVAWKDATPGHRRNDAIRRAIKHLILDYTLARGAIEGLEVRPPYSEEYLGKKHDASEGGARG